MEPLDAAFAQFLDLRAQVDSGSMTLTTEADVRLKVIDPVFCTVLGWPLSEIGAEEKSLDGFVDYNFKIDGRSRLIVEAKRDNRTLGCGNRQAKRGYVLNGPVFSAQAAQEGIGQAIRYCGSKSAELACVTNGHEWFVFRGNRLGDGRDVNSGMAFVFENLATVQDNFSFFYDLLSYESSRTFTYRAYFQEAEGRPVRATSFSRALYGPGGARLMPSTELAVDLDRIMTTFFDRLTGDKDPNLLVECFVETNESRSADRQLARISEDIVQRIRQLDTSGAAALTEVVERATQNRKHEFVVIVGTKGAGKTTFVTRFFEKILRPDISRLCVPIRINIADSPGDSREVSQWLDSNLLVASEKAIFGDEPPTFDEILGAMYFDEYTRLSKGSWSKLYETDRDQFKIQFGEMVERRRESRPNDYIARLVRFVVNSRKMLPVIIFDNADHFDIDFQEAVYRYARSIYERETCLVILPITDRTSWQLSRQGALQSFEHDALFLPTPAVEQVIKKRIEFLDSRVELERTKPDGDYFVKNGISLKVKDLAAFTKSLQAVFLNTADTSRWIGNLSNHDIRRSLVLARSFVTSPNLMIEDLIRAYYSGTSVTVSRGRATRALIRGNYRNYPTGQNQFVQNVFHLGDDLDCTPLLALRVLQMLHDSRMPDDDHGLIDVDQVIQYCQSMGIDPRQTSLCLDALLKTGLAQNYDPTVVDIGTSTQIGIAPSGRQHLYWASFSTEYLSAMADVTPIANKEIFELMREDLIGSPSDWRARTIRFIGYLRDEDSRYVQLPSHVSYKGQADITVELERTVQYLTGGQPGSNFGSASGVRSARR